MNPWLLTIVFTFTTTSGNAWAQQAPADPVVQIGIFGYAADGSSTSAAWDDEPSLKSTVYTSGTLCKVGAGNRTLPEDAMHAWQFSGRVISKNAEEAVLELNWQRVLDRGRQVVGPENSVQLTLRAGDRVPLDSIVPESSACSSTTASFEARYLPRFWRAATARAVAAGPVSTSASRPAVRPAAAMHVDLWLVHSTPGRQDEVLHQVFPAPQGTSDVSFSFTPVAITTPLGNATVHVKGAFSVRPDRRLNFVASRHVVLAGQTGAAASTATVGSGRTTSPMPTADEVLSFELPPIRSAQSGAVLPDQFSVRLRMTPN